MTADNLVLVDGDIIVYRVGFASDDSPWKICKARVDKMLTDILENTSAGVMFGYLTEGKNNYRNKIAITHPYKGNRPAKKPQYYEHIRQYLKEYHGFEIHSTQEADDALGIAQAELTKWDIREPVVIASIDKDLLMIPGKHYNIANGEFIEVGIKEARKNFYRQVLTGDRTDNIIGLKGIGPVKANKILDEGTDKGYPLAVYYAYQDHEGTLSRADENAQLIWIRRELEYEFSLQYVDSIYNRYKEH